MTLCPHSFRRVENQLVCGRCGADGLTALLDAAKSVIQCRKDSMPTQALNQRLAVLEVVTIEIDKALS